MTEKLLRDSLTEAKSKGEVGLFIWANWRVWDDLAYEMKQGNKYYDVAISIDDIKGAQINQVQALDLIYLLGVKII